MTDWFRPVEIAHMLRISPSTVRKWITAGQLETFNGRASLEQAGRIRERNLAARSTASRLARKYGGGT